MSCGILAILGTPLALEMDTEFVKALGIGENLGAFCLKVNAETIRGMRAKMEEAKFSSRTQKTIQSQFDGTHSF